jgi:long-chain acyl-CoA synthetase
MGTKLERIFDIVSICAKKYPNNIAFGRKKKGKWYTLTFSEYLHQTNKLSIWLLKYKIKQNDKVITICGNRPEWNIIDMAVQQTGAIHVPLYPTYNKDDLKLILEKCIPSFVFISGMTMYAIVSNILSQISPDTIIIIIDSNNQILSFSNILNESYTNDDLKELENIKDNISTEDYNTITFSSGTGGQPNGALFKHKACISCVTSLAPLLGLSSNDSAISYLPVSHAYERYHNYSYQILGVSIYYAESVATVIDNLAEVKPHFFCTVPLLLERTYNTLIEKFGTFEKFNAISGGNLKAISSAGAPLPLSLGQKYESIGITILEVYGISECNMVTYNLYDNRKLGTVGIPAPGVDLKFTEEGEICIKSPMIFTEYYKDPALTDLVFKDGWYYSGDIGEIDDEGFIKITGRKRDVFKISSGNYITPETIEKLLKESPYIENTFVFQMDNQLTAMVIFNSNISFDSDIQTKIKEEIHQHYNSKVFDAEQIKKLYIDNHLWSIEDGLLTPTMKIKRSELQKFYRNKLENTTPINL